MDGTMTDFRPHEEIMDQSVSAVNDGFQLANVYSDLQNRPEYSTKNSISMSEYGFPQPVIPTESTAQASHEEKVGETTLVKNDKGEVVAYKDNGVTLEKHDDGKWWVHRDGTENYREVDSQSIRLYLYSGKVAYQLGGFIDYTLGHDDLV